MSNSTPKPILAKIIEHGPLIAATVSAIASIVSAVLFLYSLRYSRESVDIALQAYRRTLDSKISARYAILGDDEYLVIHNTGPNVTRKVTVRREPFFIFRDGVRSAIGLGEDLRGKSATLAKLRSSGVLTSPDQYDDLMGPTREFSVEQLYVGQDSSLELSHFSNVNAIRIADSLNGIFVVRWRLDYEVDPDGRQASQAVDFWLGPLNTREELSHEEWGESISNRIVEAIQHSTEIPVHPKTITSCTNCRVVKKIS